MIDSPYGDTRIFEGASRTAMPTQVGSSGKSERERREKKLNERKRDASGLDPLSN